jgi:hypothetical protein
MAMTERAVLSVLRRKHIATVGGYLGGFDSALLAPVSTSEEGDMPIKLLELAGEHSIVWDWKTSRP